MSEHKSIIILAILLGVVGFLWMHEYVAPKDKVLLEAHACLHKRGYRPRDPSDPVTKEAWGACLREAEAQYGTATLRAVGY